MSGGHCRDQGVTSSPVTCGNSAATGLIVPSGEEVGREHCPACRVVAELEQHRDATAGAWSIRRATLNFAVIVARQTCPDYQPIETTTGTTIEQEARP